MNVYSLRQRPCSPARYITTSLPSWRERDRRREQRAERVAVRVLVGHDEEAVVRAERVGDRLQVTRSVISSGASSSISWVMRTPCSTDGSYSNVSCGVRFIRSSPREPALEQPVRGLEAARASRVRFAPSRAR